MPDAPAHRVIHPLRPPCTAISPHLPYPSKLTASHEHRAPPHPPHLDANTSLAPVSSLRIVSTQTSSLATTFIPERAPNTAVITTLASLQKTTYRIVLPVRRRIHCGMGRFCFWALASFCFVRKDLWDWEAGQLALRRAMWVLVIRRALTGILEGARRRFRWVEDGCCRWVDECGFWTLVWVRLG